MEQSDTNGNGGAEPASNLSVSESLIRGFSHEVKNALGAADGYLALLEDGIVGPIGPEQRDKLQRARDAIAGSVALIDDLVEVARAAEEGPRPPDGG